jgi:glycosyltransferase involved in cell wall biosynthesis
VTDAAQELGMPKERIIQFPWGVDLDHFSPGSGSDLRQALGWEDAIILLSTRNWERIYGVDHICRAFIHAASNNEKLRLIMLGDGSLRNRIGQLFQQAGLEHHVHLGGYVSYDELPKFYRAADLYISASHVDGSSISLLEAMACGIPAIVSKIPGNQEWVKPSVNGWLFEEGSPEALAYAIEEAIRNQDQMQEFGERSRQITEERADWGKNSEGVHQAYKLALAIQREQS